MRLDELPWDRNGICDQADVKSPSGQNIRVRHWSKPWLAVDTDDGYEIYVNVYADIGSLRVEEAWSHIDTLQAQCVLFELWARRNWRQRLWRRLCDWTS